MDARILLVAPFQDLYEVAEKVVLEQFGDVHDCIKVIQGNLQECMESVKQEIEAGAEVIISRGGTATLIEQNVDVPVLPIEVGVIDILRAMMTNGKYPDKVGIAGFENVIYGCEEMESLLGIHFCEIYLHDEAEAKTKIKEALTHGIELIVGDAISVKLAGELGVPGIMIHSGREAVYKVIREAQIIGNIRRQEKEKSVLVRTMIDQSAEAIIATDTDNRITLFNSMAEKLFCISHFEALGKSLFAVIPALRLCGSDTVDDVIEDIQQFDDKTIAVKKAVLQLADETIGRIYTLQNVSQIQKLEQNVRKKLHKKGLVAKVHMEDIIGTSSICIAMKKKAVKYALTQSTILVTGDSGTGKEMLVQSMHNLSTRANGPFVAVNCAALPEHLLESELFGYEEGSFTGAKRGGRQGLFELAHGGTLFLDEIGEMPISLQSRLLRVLQEKEIMHIGGDSVIPVDVRIIAATNQNLATMIEQKMFREDLYYRLNILRIHIPTLQERREDIPLLAKELVRKLGKVNLNVQRLDSGAAEYLKNCSWQGNIRQLANIIERVMLLSDGPVITKKDILEARDEANVDIGLGVDEKIDFSTDNLGEMEKETLLRVLSEEKFNYSRAAIRLGIHRTTLWRKLNRK